MVAIKLISPCLANSDRARRRFLREARSAAAIGHVNVVTIHSVNEEHGRPYLVMECLVGGSLKGRIEAGAKLDFASHPGSTIRLTEPGVYHGAAVIEEPDRLRGLTIARGLGVILTAPGLRNGVAKVAATAGVTLRELTILWAPSSSASRSTWRRRASSSRTSSFARRIRILGPTTEPTTGSLPRPRHDGRADPLPRLHLRPLADRRRPARRLPSDIAHVAIEGCRFETRLRQLEIIRSAHDIPR